MDTLINKSPNSWSCLPTAFANCIGIYLDDFLINIGHDGSEKIWPDLVDPFSRRSFHLNECLYACVNLRVPFVPIARKALSRNDLNKKILEIEMGGFDTLMSKFDGVLVGQTPKGMFHAVALLGDKIIDSNGSVICLSKLSEKLFVTHFVVMI